jgi:hypothetical protein
MFAKQIDQEMEMLRKEVLQSFALSAKAEKTAKGISERKGKEVQRAILAEDIEWQAQFEKLAEQVAKLSKARRLDAESIAEVKTRIASYPSTALPVREKLAEAALQCHPHHPQLVVVVYGILPHHSPPENNDEEGRQSLPPRRRRHYAPKYSEDDRLKLEVRETRQDVIPLTYQIVLKKKKTNN